VAAADERNNSARLSWQGTVEIEERRRDPATADEVTFTATVHYYYEHRLQSAIWSWQFREFVRRGAEGEHPLERPPVRGMLYRSAVYRVNTDPQTGQTSASIGGEEQLDGGPLGLDIGAILYWVKVEGDFVSSWLRRLLNELPQRLEKENLSVAIEEQGQLVLLRLEEPDKQRSATYTFNKSKGGLLVASRVRQGDREVVTRAELLKDTSTWIPWRALYEEYAGETLVARRSLRWTAKELAVPLETSAFTLAALGLKPGDWIHDTRMELRYRYEGEQGPAGRRPGRWVERVLSPPVLPADATPADLNLLLVLADTLRANLDALQTWAGEITVQASYAADGVHDESMSQLHYVADLARRRARWEYQRMRLTSRRGGPPSELGAGPLWRFLDTGTELYRVRAAPQGEVMHAEILSEEQRPRAPYDADALDLDFWLGIDGLRFDAWLRKLHRQAVAGSNSIGVGRQGDEVTLYLAGGWQAGGEHFTFDLARGGWLTRAQRRRGAQEVSLEIRLQPVELPEGGSLWLPLEIVYAEPPPNAAELRHTLQAEPGLRRVLTWTRSEPNPALPDDAFTPAAVGVEPGAARPHTQQGAGE
jgi:hypothetical protein